MIYASFFWTDFPQTLIHLFLASYAVKETVMDLLYELVKAVILPGRNFLKAILMSLIEFQNVFPMINIFAVN